MAATKFDCRFLKRQHFATTKEQKYETRVWTIKITGMIARSVSFSAVNWEPNLVKTVNKNQLRHQKYLMRAKDSILRQGVNRVTLRFATSF